MKFIAAQAILFPACLFVAVLSFPTCSGAERSDHQVFRIVVPPKVQTRFDNHRFYLHSSVPVAVHSQTIRPAAPTETNIQIHDSGDLTFQWTAPGNLSAVSTSVLTICPL